MNLLEEIEARVLAQELESASGLLLEVVTPIGYHQLIGPFSKDTADVYAAIERLSNEHDPEEEDNTYEIHLLFPVSSTEVPVGY